MLLVGLVSAVVLYALFVLGNVVIVTVLPFGEEQIRDIYSKGQGTSLWIMGGISLFVMGPSEEIFWRGYLQRELMNYFGEWQGWLMGTILYGGVHFWSFNLTLVLAAFVAGAFWGALYWRFNNLAPVIVSHSIWSIAVFSLFPIG